MSKPTTQSIEENCEGADGGTCPFCGTDYNHTFATHLKWHCDSALDALGME